LGNLFTAHPPQFSRLQVEPLRLAASDTLSITAVALRTLERIYKPGYRYAKAGVMLSSQLATSAFSASSLRS